LALAQGRREARARALELIPKEMRDPWDFEMRSMSIAREFRGQLPGAMAAVEAAPERLRSRLREVVFRSIAADYPEQAQQWLQENPELKEELASGIAAMMPLLSDAERGRLAVENDPGTLKDGRGWVVELTDFATHLGEVNPAQAVMLINTMREEARFRPAILLALNWSTYAPDEAGAWARSLPPGNARNAAAEGMAKSLRHDAEKAVQWAMQITEPETQFKTVKNLVQDWARADQQVAGWLMEQASLTDSQRSELQAIMEQERVRRGGAE
jgi:hypothetical protein